MTGRSASAKQGWTLEDVLSLEYPFNVLADPDDGGYVVVFPDLPGCATQIETLEELPVMVEEVRRMWLEVAFEEGMDIPLPSHEPEYSGKFNLRLPKSLHRDLARGAERDGVSLNQYVVMLLSQGHAISTLSHTNRIRRPDLHSQDRGTTYRMDVDGSSTSKPRHLRVVAA